MPLDTRLRRYNVDLYQRTFQFVFVDGLSGLNSRLDRLTFIDDLVRQPLRSEL